MTAKKIGGRRPGAGRPKGSLNKVAADVRAAAQQYTTEALASLAQIMRDGESEQARVSAANAILDRGHGKPAQVISGDAENPLTIQLTGLADALRAKLDRIAQS